MTSTRNEFWRVSCEQRAPFFWSLLPCKYKCISHHIIVTHPLCFFLRVGLSELQETKVKFLYFTFYVYRQGTRRLVILKWIILFPDLNELLIVFLWCNFICSCDCKICEFADNWLLLYCRHIIEITPNTVMMAMMLSPDRCLTSTGATGNSSGLNPYIECIFVTLSSAPFVWVCEAHKFCHSFLRILCWHVCVL